MTMLSGNEKIANIISSKQRRLKAIRGKLTSNTPQYECIGVFLEELDEVSTIPVVASNLFLVDQNTMEKMSQKADFVSIEFDGEYCKMVNIASYPNNDCWLLYIAPYSAI